MLNSYLSFPSFLSPSLLSHRFFHLVRQSFEPYQISDCKRDLTPMNHQESRQPEYAKFHEISELAKEGKW
jgi:hypothetical protein